jgi:hypothetical protein
MAVPVLYKNLILVTGDESNARHAKNPSLCRGSPFTSGLNALVKGSLGPLVHSLTLRGGWEEEDMMQRYPHDFLIDRLTILNIAVRAALDKTTRLQDFRYVKFFRQARVQSFMETYPGTVSGIDQQHCTTLTFGFFAAGNSISKCWIPCIWA